MKKCGLIAIIALLSLSLCACGRRTRPQQTEPAVTVPQSTTAPTIMPEIDPTLDTNVPDPTVNGNSTGENDIMDETTESATQGTTSSAEDEGTQQDRSARMRRFR